MKNKYDFISLSFSTVVIILNFFLLIKESTSKRNAPIYCGACLALIDEMNYEISLVDPKKLIQVGSFRIDPQGNQHLQEIPLARSDVHLTELLENICHQMTNYGRSKTADGRFVFLRTSSRDGSGISMSNIEISGGIHDQLKFACETVVEDSEEELIPAFQVGLDNFMQTICVDLLDLCNTRNITDYEEMKSRQKIAAETTTTNTLESEPSSEEQVESQEMPSNDEL